MSNFIKYNVLIHKDTEFEECLKDSFKGSNYNQVDVAKVNGEIGDDYIGIEEGRIYIAESTSSPVEWIKQLNQYTPTQLNEGDYCNKSNKAVMLLKYEGKIFSIVYGYGRTMLKDSSIVKGFGLRTAINLISDVNIKSLATLNISDDYVDTQRQALNSVSQNSLSINTNSEILKSISGKVENNEGFSTIHGSDNIQLSVSKDVTILAMLEALVSAYESESYKEKGFEWVDHIQPVKDKIIVESLKELLIAAISDLETNPVSIAPNKIIALDKVGGYLIKGMGLGKDDFYDEIPTNEYFDYIIQKGNNTVDKLKSHSLYFLNTDTNKSEKIASIYDCVLFETIYEDERYFINNGDWFKIEADYFSKIIDKINLIPKSDIVAPPYRVRLNEKYGEGAYNEEFVEHDTDTFTLFDKKNFNGTQWGRSKVEPADIISKRGQFIHVKKGGSSSTLSHLFAQGLVSSQLLKNEQEFRDFIDREVSQKFGSDFISKIKPEVIFGIIDKRYDKEYQDFLPVFSMINLCQVYDTITNLGYSCSILPIKQEMSETDSLNKKQKEILGCLYSNLSKELTVKEILSIVTSEHKIAESTLRKYLDKFEHELKKIESQKVGRSKKYKLVSNVS